MDKSILLCTNILLLIHVLYSSRGIIILVEIKNQKGGKKHGNNITIMLGQLLKWWTDNYFGVSD